MEQKKDIRKRILGLRNQISAKEWEEKSHAIYRKVVTHPFFLESNTIYCYIDYKNEVGTREIIETSWILGKKVATPKIENDTMEFFYITDFSELREGYKGILEPETFDKAEERCGLVIMPGVAFDVERHRVGYGKGFYDRFLSRNQELHTMAISFSCQMIEKIPVDKYDVCPEVLITEESIYDESYAK